MPTPLTTGPRPARSLPSGWPVRRTPRWLFAVLLAVAAGGVLVGLAHHPSPSQRAADMNGFLHDVTTDIQSCAGGVSESLTAMHAIQAGTSSDTPTAIHIARYGARNCSPAYNELLIDLTQYQVHESLASFRLDRAVNGMVDWAFDAQQVQNDVAGVLSAPAPGRAAATAKLNSDLQKLDGKRTAVYTVMRAAATATSATTPLPVLPG